MTSTQRPAGGFTLIELMVVVVVAAILAVIAVPAYTRYVTRSKLLAAQSALIAMGFDLEQYQQDHMTFVGGCPAPPVAQDFVLSCTNLAPAAYTLLATGTGSLAGFEFSLDENGNKATVSAPSGWNANATCWIADPQGDCISE